MVELLVAAVLFVAAVVQGLSGFGSGLVAMALLPLIIDVKSAIAVSAVIGVVLNGLLAWRLRSHIERSEVLPLAVSAVVGIPFGVAFLHRMDVRVVMATLGIVLVLYASWGLVSSATEARPVSRRWAWVAGLFGGLLGGAFNTSGPPILLYATRQPWSRDAFRANLQAVFVATGIAGLVGYAWMGIVTRSTLTLDLIGLPALVLGGLLGQELGGRVNPAIFRRGVLVVLLLMGLGYVARMV